MGKCPLKKKKKRRRKPKVKSPLKTIRRTKDFGSVKNLGEKSYENIAKRCVLKFFRTKHPECSRREMIRETGFSRSFVDKHWNNLDMKDQPRSGPPRSAQTPAVMKDLAKCRGTKKTDIVVGAKFVKKMNKIFVRLHFQYIYLLLIISYSFSIRSQHIPTTSCFNQFLKIFSFHSQGIYCKLHLQLANF